MMEKFDEGGKESCMCAETLQAHDEIHNTKTARIAACCENKDCVVRHWRILEE